MNPQNQPNLNLERLIKSLQGETYRDLRVFLELALEDLKSIDNIQEYSKAQDQAIEVKAQKKAYKKLHHILDKIITLSQSDTKDRSSRNDYGV